MKVTGSTKSSADPAGLADWSRGPTREKPEILAGGGKAKLLGRP